MSQHLYITDTNSQEQWRFVNPHHLNFRTQDKKEIIQLSGVVIVDFKGNSGKAWRRERIFLGVSFAHLLPKGKQSLRIAQWAPLISLNAIFNRNSSVNSGHAVDAFRLVRSTSSDPLQVGDFISRVIFAVDVAARDVDAELLRVGYYVTLKGVFDVELPGISTLT